jgi:tRNA nucleotidyltransferase (CCA-adding enzyme)
MIAVTTHSNTDFDALASMVAASFLYPGSERVLPSHVNPRVREFLAVHWDLLRIRSRREIDLSGLQRLIVTDTSSWERLDSMQDVSGIQGLNITIWDHHMSPGTINASEVYREEVGASVTLLLEEMKSRDSAFSPVHATLFLLGIYDDTGALTFPCTTSRDAHMAGFMLENGADLNVVSAYLDSSLDDRHIDLFSKMLSSSETFTRGSLRLGICVQDGDKGLNMLPAVVNKFKDIKGLDAALGIFPMSSKKTVVIGRNNARDFDLGAVMRELGGGGHPGAGSAIIQAGVKEVRERVMGLITNMELKEKAVARAMSPVTEFLLPANSMREAREIMDRTDSQVVLVVDENKKLLGSVSAVQFAKIRDERQWDKPVTSMMRGQVVSVSPDQSLREALHLMSRSEAGFLPVVKKGILMGRITRATIILDMYNF